jgi:hypothetical protein
MEAVRDYGGNAEAAVRDRPDALVIWFSGRASAGARASVSYEERHFAAEAARALQGFLPGARRVGVLALMPPPLALQTLPAHLAELVAPYGHEGERLWAEYAPDEDDTTPAPADESEAERRRRLYNSTCYVPRVQDWLEHTLSAAGLDYGLLDRLMNAVRQGVVFAGTSNGCVPAYGLADYYHHRAADGGGGGEGSKVLLALLHNGCPSETVAAF